MDGPVAQEAPPIRLETGPDGRVTNFDDFLSDLKTVAAKEGIDVADLEQKMAAKAQNAGQMTQEEAWRQASMQQIAAKRMMEHTIMVTDLATRLFELARLIPGSLQRHRQVAIDKGTMLVETFIASIPDPRGEQK